LGKIFSAATVSSAIFAVVNTVATLSLNGRAESEQHKSRQRGDEKFFHGEDLQSVMMFFLIPPSPRNQHDGEDDHDDYPPEALFVKNRVVPDDGFDAR